MKFNPRQKIGLITGIPIFLLILLLPSPEGHSRVFGIYAACGYTSQRSRVRIGLYHPTSNGQKGFFYESHRHDYYNDSCLFIGNTHIRDHHFKTTGVGTLIDRY